jgi:hypothetical protein
LSVIRHRMELLDRVSAADCDAAQAVAVEDFQLNDEQRKRLVLQEAL